MSLTEKEKRELVSHYVDTPQKEREPIADFLKRTHITRPHYYRLAMEHQAETDNLRRVYLECHPMSQIGRRKKPEEGIEVSEDEKVALARKVYQDAMKVGATVRDKDLAVRMLGMLIEKKEVTHKLDGDFIARETIRARNELESERMAQMSDESALFPPKFRLTAGQEQDKDS